MTKVPEIILYPGVSSDARSASFHPLISVSSLKVPEWWWVFQVDTVSLWMRYFTKNDFSFILVSLSVFTRVMENHEWAMKKRRFPKIQDSRKKVLSRKWGWVLGILNLYLVTNKVDWSLPENTSSDAILWLLMLVFVLCCCGLLFL